MRHTQLLLSSLTVLLLGIAAFSAQAASPIARVALPMLGCPECDATQEAPIPSPTPTTPDTSEYANEAVRLINDARIAAGCPAAKPHPILMQATQDWSEYMELSGDYRHAPSEHYSNPPFFYQWSLLENIGLSGSSLEIVDGWLSSPIHRSNLEFCDKVGDPEYDPNRIYDIGVGHSGGYWTMVLGWQ